MWYIMDADPGAQLIAGFSKDTDQNEYQQYLQNGQIEDILHYETVKRGDTFFIRTGTVHAIGAGFYLPKFNKPRMSPIEFLIGIEQTKMAILESCIPNWL